MIRKLLIVLVAIFVGAAVITALSGCTPDASEKPVSYNGTWKASGYEATVTPNHIVINMVADSDTSGLYWDGTFPVDTTQAISIADKAKLEESLLGSQDAQKVFTLSDDEIVFTMSMAGVTQKIHLKKA